MLRSPNSLLVLVLTVPSLLVGCATRSGLLQPLPPVPPAHQTIPADLKIDRSSQVQDFSNEVSTLLQEAATLFSK